MIIELHSTVYEGREYSVAALRERIESLHGFGLLARRHDVHVFEKSR